MKKPEEKLPLIVTTCSSSKRCRGRTRVDELPRGNLTSVARAWLASLRQQHDLVPAQNLYRGRAFALAREAARTMGADLGVISAGLGYVKGPTPVPSYDLTVRSYGPGSVLTRVEGEFRAQSWWQLVTKGPFATGLCSDAAERPLVLVCLSRAYASMVVGDLIDLVESEPSCLRIFGLSIEGCLPAILKKFVVPYDERLAGVGLAGTRVDFAQRALWDYVSYVAPLLSGNLEQERRIVARRLANGRRPPTRPQRRVDDSAIKALIPKLLPAIGANASRMLAHIRHREGFSCEQSRFARLFKEVRANAT
jgi:hypothetical protein